MSFPLPSNGNFPPVKAVFFDLGSTLIYFDSPWVDVFARSSREMVKALQAAGFSVDPQTFAAEFRDRLDAYYSEREAEYLEYTTLSVLRDLLAENGFTRLDNGRLAPALRAMYAVTQECWHSELEAVPTLKILRDSGYRLALISNASDDVDVQVLVDKADIRPFFEVVLTSAAVGLRKPHRRIFEIVLDRMRLDPREVVMVGDTLNADILGARNVGMRSVWITRRADPAANLPYQESVIPDAVAADLTQLPGVLACWERA